MLNQSTFTFLLFVLLWFIIPISGQAQDAPASKAELEASLRPLKDDIKDVKQDVRVLSEKLSQKIDGVRGEISGLRSDMREDFKNVEGRIGAIGERIDSIYSWIVGGAIAIIVALLGLIGTLWHTRSKPENFAKSLEEARQRMASTTNASEATLSDIASSLQELAAFQRSSLDLNDRLNALKEDNNERE